MLTIKAEAFVRAISSLAAVRQILDNEESNPQPISGDNIREELIDVLTALSEQIVPLNVKITKMAIDDLITRIAAGAIHSTTDLRIGFDDIDRTFRRELSDVELISLDSLERKLFEPDDPLFGAEVAAKFSSISYEIAEAGKCLALGRSTAGAFHSIRCLEAGIRAMSRCLGISDPTRGVDRSWAKLLGAIKTEIDKRWNPSLIRSGGDAELFENAYAALSGMQNPWRNSTMHLDQIYTPEDARHIFEIIGGFMRTLASRMDEDGNPTV
jgi:hypothetical protein